METQATKWNRYSTDSAGKTCGFSLIEILVTLVIIAVALLGTASLIVNAMRMNLSGEFRTLAVFLASDIAERMEVNRAAAVTGQYAVAPTGAVAAVPATDCITNACTQAKLALYDIYVWEQAVSTLLPQSSWQIVQTAAGNPSTYTVTINWIDRRGKNQYSTAGVGETFSYVATRTVASN